MAHKTGFEKVAVLMGGLSAEREVSLKSGEACLKALVGQGYDAFGVDAGRDVAEVLAKASPDAAFIALHGRYGEDGTIQGVLELLEIPYTGSGVLASALAIDKVMSKKVFRQEGIPVARDVDCDTAEFKAGANAAVGRIVAELPLPVIVKPSREGSTIGVTVVEDANALAPALETALRCDDRVLVEEFVPGALLTVALIGLEPRALPLVEIRAKSGFYDYRSKYTAGMTEYICPAELPADVAGRIQDVSVKAHQALDCRDISRVDVILAPDGRFVVLEINTLPGMTETSLVPKAAEAAGIGFADLADEILAGASLKLKPKW